MSIQFVDTCVRIGNSRAPDPPGNARTVQDLCAMMRQYRIAQAVVEHAVAMEASPRLGHELLAAAIQPHPELRPAWHLMPYISNRIERAVTDPAEFIANRVGLGRIDAEDFLNGMGDKAGFAPVLQACEAIALPIFIDFRRKTGDLLMFDYGICERYPGIPFVIEAAGGYPFHRIMWCFRNYPNFHLSTVGLGEFNGVQFMCDEVGPDRIIFGSNWPAANVGMGQGHVLLAGISGENRARIASGNFNRLLNHIGKKQGTHGN